MQRVQLGSEKLQFRVVGLLGLPGFRVSGWGFRVRSGRRPPSWPGNLESFLPCAQCLLRLLRVCFCPCLGLSSSSFSMASAWALQARLVTARGHGAGVLAGRRRLVRVLGVCPTANHALFALMSVWTHAASWDVGPRTC